MNIYKKTYQQFKKAVQKDWGEKCDEYSFGCILCNAWKVVDGVEELAEWIEDLEKNKKMHTHKK